MNDCAGGQTLGSRGAEREFGNAVIGLVRQAVGCPSAWKFAPPAGYTNPRAAKYARRGAGSANHQLLWLTYLYGWAMAAGNAAQRAEAIAMLAEFYDWQATTGGHMLAEMLTTSHCPQWYTGVYGGRVLARVHGEPTILMATGKWARRDLHLLNLLEVDGHPTSPGSRPAGSTRELRTVIRAQLSGARAPTRVGSVRPIVGKPNDPKGLFWSHPVNVGAWFLRLLLRDGDDVAGAAAGWTEKPVLRNALEVYRKPNGDYLFLFEDAGPKVGPGMMFWTARIDGERIDAPYHRGATHSRVFNPYPPPGDWSGVPLTVVPGVPSG